MEDTPPTLLRNFWNFLKSQSAAHHRYSLMNARADNQVKFEYAVARTAPHNMEAFLQGAKKSFKPQHFNFTPHILGN